MRNKKIIFSSYDSIKNPFYGGGGALATHKIASLLVKKNYDVVYLAGKYPASKDEVLDGVSYKYFGLGNNMRVNQLIFPLFLWYRVIFDEFDVWFENFYPPFSTSFLPVLTKRPVVGVASLLHAEKFNQKYGLPFDKIETLGLKTYGNILLLTDELKSKIERINPSARISVIPRGIDPRYLKAKIRRDNYILFLGRIDIYQKGLDLLIPAWKKYLKRNPEDRLVIAGGGLEFEITNLRKLIDKYNLNDSVRYVGKVEGKSKERLLANCKFGVSPSRFEGFGNTVVEFLAFGKAVSCFEIPSFKKLPKQAVFAAKVINSDALYESILKASVSAPNHVARKFSGNFTIDKIVNNYDELIKSL